MILRDLDLLQQAAEAAPVSAAFSIGTLDEQVWRETEPGTPHPKARMEAVRTLTEAGIPTGILMAPILPGISDRPDQLREVVDAAIDAGATHVSPILLHLRPGVREEFLPWLEQEHPDLVEPYLQMYRQPYGPKATRESLGRQVSSMVAAAGGIRRGVDTAHRFFRRHRSPRAKEQASEQLRLL